MKTSCPQCPSSDAFELYDDGHGHCFSCGFHQKSDALSHMESIMKEGNDSQNHHIVKRDVGIYMLPDADKTIPVKCLNWLAKYGIMREEIVEHELRYSPSRDWLIFPVRGGNGELLAYTARCWLGEVFAKPKWQHRGAITEVSHMIGWTKHADTPVVLVEDPVSAIKVARVCRAMPLFGSACAPKRIIRLRHFAKKLIIWLDKDKYKDALSIAKRAELVGLETHVLYTEKDPKDHSDQDIAKLVRV